MTEPAVQPTVDHATLLLDFLEQHKAELSPLLILTHDYPDPDALAAAVSLQYLVEKRHGIEAHIAFGGVVGRNENRAMMEILKITARRFRPTLLKKFKNLAMVDTQPRFGNNSLRPNRKVTLVIDQHSSVEPPLADLALIDPDCGATCVIVAQALLRSGLEIPARIATAIAYGILSDTLDLYRAKREDVIQTYLGVLPFADMKALARIQNPPRTRPFFLSLCKGIQNAVSYHKLIISHLGIVDGPELVGQVAEFLLTYRSANWTMCTGRHKDRLYVSLRSAKQSVSAGDILRSIFPDPKQAGGHGPIGGGSWRLGEQPTDEAWRAVELDLQTGIAKRLRIPAHAEFRKIFQT